MSVFFDTVLKFGIEVMLDWTALFGQVAIFIIRDAIIGWCQRILNSYRYSSSFDCMYSQNQLLFCVNLTNTTSVLTAIYGKKIESL